MTYIEVISALIILSIFFTGFAQVLLPVHNAWNIAINELKIAKSMYFLAESFKNECAKTNRNIDNWIKAVAVVKELESFEIIEMKQGETIKALKAICNIAGERIEIIGLCAQ